MKLLRYLFFFSVILAFSFITTRSVFASCGLKIKTKYEDGSPAPGMTVKNISSSNCSDCYNADWGGQVTTDSNGLASFSLGDDKDGKKWGIEAAGGDCTTCSATGFLSITKKLTLTLYYQVATPEPAEVRLVVYNTTPNPRASPPSTIEISCTDGSHYLNYNGFAWDSGKFEIPFSSWDSITYRCSIVTWNLGDFVCGANYGVGMESCTRTISLSPGDDRLINFDIKLKPAYFRVEVFDETIGEIWTTATIQVQDITNAYTSCSPCENCNNGHSYDLSNYDTAAVPKLWRTGVDILIPYQWLYYNLGLELPTSIFIEDPPATLAGYQCEGTSQGCYDVQYNIQPDDTPVLFQMSVKRIAPIIDITIYDATNGGLVSVDLVVKDISSANCNEYEGGNCFNADWGNTYLVTNGNERFLGKKSWANQKIGVEINRNTLPSDLECRGPGPYQYDPCSDAQYPKIWQGVPPLLVRVDENGTVYLGITVQVIEEMPIDPVCTDTPNLINCCPFESSMQIPVISSLLSVFGSLSPIKVSVKFSQLELSKAVKVLADSLFGRVEGPNLIFGTINYLLPPRSLQNFYLATLPGFNPNTDFDYQPEAKRYRREEEVSWEVNLDPSEDPSMIDNTLSYGSVKDYQPLKKSSLGLRELLLPPVPDSGFVTATNNDPVANNVLFSPANSTQEQISFATGQVLGVDSAACQPPIATSKKKIDCYKGSNRQDLQIGDILNWVSGGGLKLAMRISHLDWIGHNIGGFPTDQGGEAYISDTRPDKSFYNAGGFGEIFKYARGEGEEEEVYKEDKPAIGVAKAYLVISILGQEFNIPFLVPDIKVRHMGGALQIFNDNNEGIWTKLKAPEAQ